MSIELFVHPFASFCWKPLIAAYERQVAFTYREIGPDHPDNLAEFARRWPIGQFPVLADGERTLVESAVIVEYLDRQPGQGNPMIPVDPDAALEARMMDRIFDDYLALPVQRIVGDFMRAPEERDPRGVAEATKRLDAAYDWLESRMAGRTWAVGDFSLADCSAAPALFYADWIRRIGPERPVLSSYRARLLARPSVARVVEEARPYRSLFPPGAPDRD